MELEEYILEKPRETVYRMVQYGFISLTGLLLENAVLFMVVEYLKAGLVPGKLFGAELSIVLMFFLNNRFTFSDRPGVTLKRFLKSNLVRSGGVIIGVVVLKAGTQLGIWYIFANLAGIAAGFTFNFVLESIYTWAEE